MGEETWQETAWKERTEVTEGLGGGTEEARREVAVR